ncbi:MAG: pro-sigmaK processing inhibitor BofA family protein [Bacillaceae bacterium]|nr:pro-sigmaK processing inhibitor BofA family protein [Bacillaceae bacterium]
MSSYLVIGIILILILFLFISGIPTNILRLVSQGFIKVVIGALLLFFLNVFGASFGIHVPINLFTTIIAGFLGIPGLVSLVAIQMIVFP